ncbi:hypothetical protein AB0I02_21890 [Streptomyces phaeochromogenes]
MPRLYITDGGFAECRDAKPQQGQTSLSALFAVAGPGRIDASPVEVGKGVGLDLTQRDIDAECCAGNERLTGPSARSRVPPPREHGTKVPET